MGFQQVERFEHREEARTWFTGPTYCQGSSRHCPGDLQPFILSKPLQSPIQLKVVDIDIATFNILPSPYRSFSVTDGKSSDVVSFLTSLAYQGGTSLACLKDLTKSKTYDAFLVFTDGFDNFGDTNNYLSHYEAPHFMISASTSINTPLLKVCLMSS